MRIRYWKNRYLLFRKGYIRSTSHWLITKGLWLMHAFATYVIPYLIYPEINQFRLLSEKIQQQERYIASLHDNSKQAVKQIPKEIFRLRHIKLKIIVQGMLLPVAIAGFIIRKLLRIFRLRDVALQAIANADYSPSGSTGRHPDNCAGCHTLVTENPAGRFPAGLAVFRYCITGTARDKPILFLDPGAGFADEFSIPLPYSGGALKECLVDMPPYTRSLRLCTGAHQKDLKPCNLEFAETNLFLAARRHARLDNVPFLRSLYEIFIREFPWTRRPLGHNQTYAAWINRFDTLSPADIRAIDKHIFSLQEPFSIKVIINCRDGDCEQLKRSIESIQSQLYPGWKLLLVSESELSTQAIALLTDYQRSDERITFMPCINRLNPQTIIGTIAGDSAYCAYLDQGDTLPRHALYQIAIHFIAHQDTSLLYTDHDYMDACGNRTAPFFKPDWNLDMFLSTNYLLGIVALPSRILQATFNRENPGEILHPEWFLYRLICGLQEHTIRRLPFILCHKTAATLKTGMDYETDCDQIRKIITDNLAPDSHAVLIDPEKRIFKISRPVGRGQPISLIVPTRNHYALLSNCISGILERTDYRDLELVIVDNGSDDAATLDYLRTLRDDSRVNVIEFPGEFNYSAINNFAVAHCRNEYIGLINNDISIIHASWLTEMMSHILREEVGIVGAKLLYGNDTIQHAGVIIGLGGVAGHAFRHFPGNGQGVNNRLLLTQQLSCVTGACLITKQSIYQKVGGLDEVNLRIAFNDVDYCLKVRDLGYKIIWTPYAELYHLESASRGFDLNDENIERWQSEYDFMKSKWNGKLLNDSAYNPNLTIVGEDFSLAHRPRIHRPWTSIDG